jgi:hypothetical protein
MKGILNRFWFRANSPVTRGKNKNATLLPPITHQKVKAKPHLREFIKGCQEEVFPVRHG